MEASPLELAQCRQLLRRNKAESRKFANILTRRFLDRTTPPHILTLVLMAGMSAMNMSIFLPSLPAMTQEFGTDYAVMQLSVSVYLGCTALLQVMIGPISDRFGRRSVTLVSLVIFVLATAGCYMSTSVEMFLAFRMVQATIAVGMVLSRAIVRDMYGQEESASMIGYVTMGMSIVPMIAPSIGGALDTAFGWRATFIFLMIFGSAMALLCWADQGETAATEVFDQPVAMTGFFLGVPAIGYALGNFLSGRYSVRYGINRMIVAGSIVQFVGLGLSLVVSYLGYGSAWMFFAFVTFVGLGNGLVLPNANAGLLSVRPHLAGTASGVGCNGSCS